MTDKPEPETEAQAKSGHGKTIDMYHFFSRWDVLLFGAFILLILLVVLYLMFAGGPAPA